MSRRTAIMLTLCGMATAAPAGWDGFPLVNTATNYITWEQMLADLDEHPFQQLVNALNERRAAANLAALQRVYTNSVGPATNETTITWTNKWGFFEALPGVTAAAPVVRADILAFDAALQSAAPSFLTTNLFGSSADGLTNWYVDFRTNLPVEAWAGWVWRTGGGLATNLATNAYGCIVAGEGYLLRTPPTVSYWPVAEIRWTGNAWTLSASAGGFIATNDGARMHDPAILPSLVFETTNPVPACSLSITGLVLDLADFAGAQGGIATGETVAVLAGATATVCTLPWQSVTAIGCTATGAWGDVVRLIYTNAVYTVGDYPYDLHAADLDERRRIVDAMRITWRVPVAASNANYAKAADSYPFGFNTETQSLRWASSPTILSTQTLARNYYRVYAMSNPDGWLDAERRLASLAFQIASVSTAAQHSATFFSRSWASYGLGFPDNVYICDLDNIWLDVAGVGTGRTVAVETFVAGGSEYMRSAYYRTQSDAPSRTNRHEFSVARDRVNDRFAWTNPMEVVVSQRGTNWPSTVYQIQIAPQGVVGEGHDSLWFLGWDVTNGFDYVSE